MESESSMRASLIVVISLGLTLRLIGLAQQQQGQVRSNRWLAT